MNKTAEEIIDEQLSNISDIGEWKEMTPEEFD